MKIRMLILTTFSVLSLLNTSHAALNDNGDGTVNNTVQNIVWLQDANQVKTSCDADDALWQAFDPAGVTNNTERTKAQICTDNGRLNWFEAEAWMAVLNAQNYKGHNDWRQPSTAQSDPTCESQTGDVPPQGFGYNCRGSELGHLFNIAAPEGLGNPNHAGTGVTGGTVGTGCFGIASHCFQNTAPFNNTQSFAYWSGTEFAPFPPFGWFFNTVRGSQLNSHRGTSRLYVWPVRPGQQVAASAQPIPSLSIWGIILLVLTLGLLARRRAW